MSVDRLVRVLLEVRWKAAIAVVTAAGRHGSLLLVCPQPHRLCPATDNGCIVSLATSEVARFGWNCSLNGVRI